MTVVAAAAVGAVLIGTSSSVGSAKIIAVSAEAGTAESPVFIQLLGGANLGELVKIYAYDEEGNNFAVTKADAVFSPGQILLTESAGTPQKGGMQRVSLTGEFADGTKQWLWEGELELVEGGEVVWMTFEEGKWKDGKYITAWKYPESGYYNYYEWKLFVSDKSGTKLGSIPITFKYDDEYCLTMTYYDSKGDLASDSIPNAPAEIYNNRYVQAASLFAPFGKTEIKVDKPYIGRVLSRTGSNQVFKTYIPEP